jgi:hypothetical protein
MYVIVMLPVDAEPIRAVVVIFGVGDALQGTFGRQTGQTMSVKVPFGWQVIVTGWSLFPGMNPKLSRNDDDGSQISNAIVFMKMKTHVIYVL